MKLIKQALFAGHQSAVYALTSVGNGKFYSAGSDRIVAGWDRNQPEEGEMIARATDVIYSLLVNNQNQLLVAQAKGEVHVIDLAIKAESRLLKVHESAIFKLAQAEQSTHLYVLAGDGSFAVLDSMDYSVLARHTVSSGKLRSIAFHPDGNLVAIGCGEGYVQFVENSSLKLLDRIRLHESGFSVNALTFSPDGKFLLSGSRDAHLVVYEVHSGALVHRIPAHNYAIYDIVYHPSGKFFATASRDKSLKLWNAGDFSFLARYDSELAGGHVNSVNCLLWDRDGEFLYSAGDDRAIIGWKAIDEG